MNTTNIQTWLFIAILPILASNVESQQISEDFFDHDFVYNVTDGVTLLVDKGIATLFLPFENFDWGWVQFEEKNLIYDTDGFAHLDIIDSDMIVIVGGNHFYYESGSRFNIKMYDKAQSKPGFDGIKTYEFNIQSVIASSILTEEINNTLFEYNTDHIMNRFMRDSMGIERFWNHYALPWVEGVEGTGIGEKLEVKFIKTSNHIIILNGFVDPARKYLYKQNSRIKKLRVTSNDSNNKFESEYEFEDVVKFSYIPFPVETNSVKLEILETYLGSKWQDTSISGVLTNHTWTLDELEDYRGLKKPNNQFILEDE